MVDRLNLAYSRIPKIAKCIHIMGGIEWYMPANIAENYIILSLDRKTEKMEAIQKFTSLKNELEQPF